MSFLDSGLPGIKADVDTSSLAGVESGGISGEDLIKKSSADAPSGFYYDQQLQNRALCMTLHPNRIWDEEHQSWEAVTRGGTGKDSLREGTDASDAGLIYDVEPIAVSIIHEDFQVGIHNEWSYGGGSDDISSMFNSLKSYAPYIGEISDTVRDKSREYLDDMEAKGDTDSLGYNLTNWANWLGQQGGKLESVMNRALVIQGTRFSYYNGTGVAFGNLTMKVHYFSDWNPQTGKWESCYDRMKKLVPYMIGAYKNFADNEGQFSNWNKFVGWQLPPGDFSASMKTLDAVQKGTLMVKFANLYSIPNLVIQDAQINFSKTMVKHPSNENPNEISVDPLYCEINLTLMPAAKYTGEKLIESIMGVGLEAEKKNYETEINKRLKHFS